MIFCVFLNILHITYVFKEVWFQIELYTRHVVIILDRSYIRIVFA